MITREQVALVTGAAAGIGLATARRLWSDGYAVVLADLDGDRAEAERKALDPAGEDSLAVAADVTSTPAVDALVARAGGRFGRIDALVNNAGRPTSAPAAELEDDQWRAALDVNLHSALRCSRAALPLLLRATAPAVVNMASAAALVGMPGRAAYGAAKAGVSALTRTLAVEWAPHGIRINAVAPGYIATAGFDERVGLARSRELCAQVPLNRLGRPEEIASVVSFLVGADAAYVTGQTLAIDGALTVAGHG